MSRYAYTRLSAQDNDFLRWETRELPMHGVGVQIFTAGPLARGGGVNFEAISQAVAASLPRTPRLRQKVVRIPRTDRFVWVDDEHFQLDHHLRHVALAHPGCEAQLRRLVSHVAETPLDRGRHRELAEMGVFSLRLPEAQGGVGLGMAEAVLVFAELGRRVVPGPLLWSHLLAGLVPGAATGETIVGGLNGILFALIMGALAGVWHRGMGASESEAARLALVIGAAMIINLVAAGLAGILVPLGLQRAGADPAVSSAVFVTTVTDVVGFFVFLGLAALILL